VRISHGRSLTDNRRRIVRFYVGGLVGIVTFPAEGKILSHNQGNGMAIRALHYALFTSVLDTDHVSGNSTMSKSKN